MGKYGSRRAASNGAARLARRWQPPLAAGFARKRRGHWRSPSRRVGAPIGFSPPSELAHWSRLVNGACQRWPRKSGEPTIESWASLARRAAGCERAAAAASLSASTPSPVSADSCCLPLPPPPPSLQMDASLARRPAGRPTDRQIRRQIATCCRPTSGRLRVTFGGQLAALWQPAPLHWTRRPRQLEWDVRRVGRPSALSAGPLSSARLFRLVRLCRGPSGAERPIGPKQRERGGPIGG